MSAAAPAEDDTLSATSHKIQEIMFGGAFDAPAWQKLETFAAGKAREARSARLKRTNQPTAAATLDAPRAQRRRTVHVTRRK